MEGFFVARGYSTGRPVPITIDTETYRKDKAHAPGHGYGRVVKGGPHARTPAQIKAILVHTTNNPDGNTLLPPEAKYLRNAAIASCHYVVSSHDRTVVQILPDEWIAWHAGDCVDNDYQNPTSIGIEIAWAPQAGTLPRQAIQNVTDLVAELLRRYPHIRKIDMHRRQAVPSGRKTDPAGWQTTDFDAWRAALLRLSFVPPLLPVTENAPILSAPRCSLEQARALFRRHAPHNGYTEADVGLVILPAYFNACAPLGLDPAVAVAQMAHETGYLTSFWSARPQRNPAGIGVNGEAYPHKPANAHGFRYNAQRRMWERGLSFGGWLSDSIPAHLGRLLAYVLPPGHGTPEQRAAVNRALAYRPLPEVVRGSAQTLKQLGRVHNPSGVGWASPGDRYGEALAKVINEMRAL